MQYTNRSRPVGEVLASYSYTESSIDMEDLIMVHKKSWFPKETSITKQLKDPFCHSHML